MKAMLYHKYGSVDMLKLEEVDQPVPKPDEVLIKVHAAAVNSWDWDLLRGKPFLARLGGIRKPQFKILGADVAGVIEAIGDNVKQFKRGDAVFGDLCTASWGGFAEYVCAPEKVLSSKPEGITYGQAAALPQAGVMALQGIRDYRQLRPGQQVLINGAAGGVGTFAIQLAKLFGTEVTAVDRTDKLERLRWLGVDYVVDYTQEDFTRNGKQFDLILDVAAHRSIFDYRRALRPGGIYLVIGGTMSTIFQFMLLGPIISLAGNRKLRLLIHQPNKDLTFLSNLVESGEVKPIIHKYYSLNNVPEALQCLGDGNAVGKLVISFSS